MDHKLILTEDFLIAAMLVEKLSTIKIYISVTVSGNFQNRGTEEWIVSMTVWGIKSYHPSTGVGTDKNTGMNMGVIYNTYGYWYRRSKVTYVCSVKRIPAKRFLT